MKKSAILLAITFLTLFIASGCYDEVPVYEYDDNPPNPPSNVYLINGDNRVDITWKHNSERDVAGYNVYISSDDYEFELIGSTGDNYFIDDYVRNGEFYYYAVTAYDDNGNESDLSIEQLPAAPRPEGFNKTVYDFRRFPDLAGYSFAGYTTVAYDSKFADFFFENYNGIFYLDVWDEADIQDMGPTTDIYDIPEAPETGWAPAKEEIAQIGHTYVIWTVDNHFAKIRVKTITNDRIVFDWAYQTLEGVKLLKNAKTGTYQTRNIDKKEFENRILNRKK